MFKLYKKFKPLDWVFVVLIIGFTILQVFCTMKMVDYVQGIIQSISYLNIHNNPSQLGDMYTQLEPLFANGVDEGWKNILNMISSNPAIANNVDVSVINKIADASVGDIWFNGGMMILVSACGTLCQVINSVLASAVAANQATVLRKELNEKVSSFSLAEINKFSTASLVTRTTNDIEQVQMTNLLMMRMVFAAPVTAIWAICKVQATSGELTIATAIAIVALIIMLGIVMLFVIPKFKSVQKLIDKINGLTQENLTGIRVIRAYNAEGYQEDKFEKANNALTKTQIFTGRLTGLMFPIMSLVMNALTLTIYWLGASLINAGTTDYSTITSFSMLASQIIMSFMMLLMMFVMWPRASVCAKRINDVLETKASITDPEVEKPLVNKGTVEFKNVSFKYPFTFPCATAFNFPFI